MTRAARILVWTSLAACAGIVWLVFAAPHRDWFLRGIALVGLAGWNVAGWLIVATLEAESQR